MTTVSDNDCFMPVLYRGWGSVLEGRGASTEPTINMAEEPLVKMKRRRGNLEGEEGETVAKKGKIEESLLPSSASLLSLSDDVLLGVLR